VSDLSMAKKPVSFNLKEQLTALNLHWAGVGLLALVNLYLLIHLGILWSEARGQSADALAAQRVQLVTAKQLAKPLEGLDAKLKTADVKADKFYAERLPVSYSEIATQLGVLKKEDNVRLAGANYSQEPVVDVSSMGQLTEVRIDARLSGDYIGLVRFLNGLERDKVFFVINGVTLTGQESGRVNLRVKLTTYLRGLSSDEEAARASTPISVSDEMQQQVEATPAVQGGRR
jgi:type IV pilus assembly protein PilO